MVAAVAMSVPSPSNSGGATRSQQMMGRGPTAPTGVSPSHAASSKASAPVNRAHEWDDECNRDEDKSNGVSIGQGINPIMLRDDVQQRAARARIQAQPQPSPTSQQQLQPGTALKTSTPMPPASAAAAAVPVTSSLASRAVDVTGSASRSSDVPSRTPAPTAAAATADGTKGAILQPAPATPAPATLLNVSAVGNKRVISPNQQSASPTRSVGDSSAFDTDDGGEIELNLSPRDLPLTPEAVIGRLPSSSSGPASTSSSGTGAMHPATRVGQPGFHVTAANPTQFGTGTRQALGLSGAVTTQAQRQPPSSSVASPQQLPIKSPATVPSNSTAVAPNVLSPPRAGPAGQNQRGMSLVPVKSFACAQVHCCQRFDATLFYFLPDLLC